MDKLRQLFSTVRRQVQQRPVAVLLLAVLLIFTALGGAAQITSIIGDAAFVVDNLTFDASTESLDQGSIVVLVRGDITEPQALHAIDRVGQQMSTKPNAHTVTSPADQVRQEYGRIPDSEAEIRSVVGLPNYTVVQIVFDTGLSQTEGRPIYTQAVGATDWAELPSGATVTVTGNTTFSARLSTLIQQSTRQLLGLAIGLMVVTLFFLFHSVRLRLLPIVAIFVGAIYTFEAIGYAGVPNSTVTSAVFPILIGLGIDCSVQFHERYEEELENHPPREALPQALGGIGPPVFVAMLAATLGLGAAWVSTSSLSIIWFAQTSIFGVLLIFTAGIFVLLPLLTLWVRRRGDAEDETPDKGDAPTTATTTQSQDQGDSDHIGLVGELFSRSARILAGYPVLVLSIALLIALVGFQAGGSLDTLADTEKFIPQDLPAYTNLQQFRSVADGGSSTSYDVLVTGTNLKYPATLQWMLDFERIATQTPLVQDVDSPATLVKQYNGGQLPQTENGVKCVLEAVPERRKLQYYNDGRAHIMVYSAQDMTTQQALSFLENTYKSIAYSSPPSGMTAEITGTAAIATPPIVEQINSWNVTTGLGVLFVFTLLLVYYRNLVKAVAPFIPMVFVIGWQNIYMYLLDIPTSPLGASLGVMTVGIGAEHIIIVMDRYYQEKQRTGVSRLDAVQTVATRVGKAISISGMTAVFDSSALVLSPFLILSGFGFLTVGVVFLMLIASLTTLPPTLVLLDSIAERVAASRSS